jgi:SAM-dependent methyltransferase
MSIVERPVMPEELARLKRQREEADERYNEALTALDQAIAALQPPALPALPSPPDEAQITPLNERWAITANAPALPEGWRGRAAAFVMSLVRPYLERQEAFNATLVDHVNRSVLPARAQVEAARASLVALQAQHQHVERLQSKLILLLQQITPFVDSKDYEFYAISQQIADSVQGLAAALSDVSDDMLKRWERYESLRASVSTLQVAVQALRRELQQRGPVSQATVGATATGASLSTAPPSPVGATPLSPATTASVHLSSDPLAAHTYVAFENVFRGDPQVIAERQQSYVDLFRGRQDVLDIGCGRGEFLKLLHGHGTWARGIDLNHEMVALCRADGLDVTEADALTYLRQCRDGELGGLIALQVVEHLPPDYLLELVDEAHRVLSPGSPILLETINVASWSAFFSSYLRDITHMRPLHPDTLRFLVDAAGFADTEVQLRAPIPAAQQLGRTPEITRLTTAPGESGQGLAALYNSIDRNVNLLNDLIFAPQDYAVVGWKR